MNAWTVGRNDGDESRSLLDERAAACSTLTTFWGRDLLRLFMSDFHGDEHERLRVALREIVASGSK